MNCRCSFSECIYLAFSRYETPKRGALSDVKIRLRNSLRLTRHAMHIMLRSHVEATNRIQSTMFFF
jgi:hypothetical protein